MNQEQMNTLSLFVTLLLQAIITVGVPFLFMVVFKWAMERYKLVKSIVSSNQMNDFRNLVIMVVGAAEQSGLAQLIVNTGIAKKQYALNVLQAIVEAHGWNIPVAQIEAEIEHAIANEWHLPEVQQQLQSAQGFLMSDVPQSESEPMQPDLEPVSPKIQPGSPANTPSSPATTPIAFGLPR